MLKEPNTRLPCKNRAKTHQRVTRQNNDLTLPRYRLATGQKTFTYREAKLCNNIAKEITDTGNLLKREFLNIFLIHR